MSDRRLTVLYGSQTGTAQEVAERIWRESKRFHWCGPIKAMDDLSPPDLLAERLVIFVCSTTGQGDEPDNMQRFWRFLLRKSLPANSLSHLHVAVLGLGDSSYTKFNFAAKKLHKRLLQLGASCMIDLGIADDQHDLGADAVIEPWLASLWTKLSQFYPLPIELNPLDESVLSPPRYRVRFLKAESVTTKDASPGDKGDSEEGYPTTVHLVGNTRTTSEDHFQDVRVLRLRAPELKYKPGDVLMVQPHNLEENVALFLELLALEASDVIDVQQAEGLYSIELPPRWLSPEPCTIGDCARCLLDLQAVPQRYSLQLLAHFTTSELERERLLEFCSPQGQQDLFDYCHRPRRNILEVLQDFPHATAALPVEYLFDVFRPIRPRAFSIASASELCEGEVQLLVAVVHYKTRLQAPRLGLCSNWLARLAPGAPLSAWVRPGSFRFPASPEVPLIMVGPGTGCAPFRSLVQQRAALHPQVKGKLVLFFGCRKQQGDFHCSEEWQGYVASGLLSLFCAFSQDQQDKRYVQHVLLEQACLVWQLLGRGNAHLLVAGNAKNMPGGVRDAILQIAHEEGGLTEEQAQLFVLQLENCGRYQTETWA